MNCKLVLQKELWSQKDTGYNYPVTSLADMFLLDSPCSHLVPCAAPQYSLLKKNNILGITQ